MKLEKMMKEDGWELKYYIHKNVKYFSFHKNGFEVACDDIVEDAGIREWREVKWK